jgi:hypothetical protein
MKATSFSCGFFVARLNRIYLFYCNCYDMRTPYMIILLIVLSIIASCKKSNDKSCWQGFDPAGYDMPGLVLCDKTLAESEAAYPQYWFHDVNETKFCWRVQTTQGQTFYMRDIPQSMVDKMRPYGGYTYVKVDCGSFCRWRYNDKVQSKTTNLFGAARTSVEVYMADSCSRLYAGRIITLRETADSIYTREFVRQE